MRRERRRERTRFRRGCAGTAGGFHLSDAACGAEVVYLRPESRCGPVRRYLTRLGILPGARLRVVSAPSDGEVIIAVEGARVALPPEMTSVMIVE